MGKEKLKDTSIIITFCYSAAHPRPLWLLLTFFGFRLVFSAEGHEELL